MKMSKLPGRNFTPEQTGKYLQGGKRAAAALAVFAVCFPIRAEAITYTILQNQYWDFDYMANHYERIKNYDLMKQNISDAEKIVPVAQKYVEQAEIYRRTAEKDLRRAEENEKQAKTWVKSIEAHLHEARENLKVLARQAAKSRQALADYQPAWQTARASLRDSARARQAEAAGDPQRIAAIDAWVKEAQNYHTSASRHLEELQSSCQAAEAYEAEAHRRIQILEKELAKNKQYERQYRQDVETCKKNKATVEKSYVRAVQERDECIKRVEKAKEALKNFGDWASVQKTFEYYTWKGSSGGRQFYTPHSLYWSGNRWDVFIHNAYVYSDTGLPNGKMSGFTDTVVSGMYNNRHPLYDVRYGLSVNLPTGESRVHDNAVVPDYLARVSRLGEGWIFTPRLEVTRHIDKFSDLTWRGAYSFRGSYADSKDSPESRAHPGGLLSNELEYIHTDQTTHYMGRLYYTVNGKGSVDRRDYHSKFREGNGFAALGFYRKWFTPRDSYGAYAILSLDQPTSYYYGGTSGSILRRTHGGVGWFHRFDAKRQLRLFANGLWLNGSAYDPLTKQTYASGRRASVSLTYDWRMDSWSSMFFELERAIMHKENTDTCQSWGLVVGYTRGI